MNIYIKVIIRLYYYIIWYFQLNIRKKVFDNKIDKKLREVCIDISQRYEIVFVEIGNDEDHVHFLVQSVPTISVTKLVTTIKSITAREIFKQFPQLKKEMWGSSLWTSGYYVNTVGLYASKDTIKNYIKNQGSNEKEYVKIYDGQLKFDL